LRVEEELKKAQEDKKFICDFRAGREIPDGLTDANILVYHKSSPGGSQ